MIHLPGCVKRYGAGLCWVESNLMIYEVRLGEPTPTFPWLVHSPSIMGWELGNPSWTLRPRGLSFPSIFCLVPPTVWDPCLSY